MAERRQQREELGRKSADRTTGEGYHIEPHGPLTAYDFRHDLQGWLGWSDDELRQLPVVYGLDLSKTGEVYFDLDHMVEFRGNEAAAHPGCRAVPKREVPLDVWLRLAATAGHEDRPAGNAASKAGAFGDEGEL